MWSALSQFSPNPENVLGKAVPYLGVYPECDGSRHGGARERAAAPRSDAVIHLEEAATGTPSMPKDQAAATAIAAPPTNIFWTAGHGPHA